MARAPRGGWSRPDPDPSPTPDPREPNGLGAAAIPFQGFCPSVPSVPSVPNVPSVPSSPLAFPGAPRAPGAPSVPWSRPRVPRDSGALRGAHKETPQSIMPYGVLQESTGCYLSLRPSSTSRVSRVSGFTRSRTVSAHPEHAHRTSLSSWNAATARRASSTFPHPFIGQNIVRPTVSRRMRRFMVRAMLIPRPLHPPLSTRGRGRILPWSGWRARTTRPRTSEAKSLPTSSLTPFRHGVVGQEVVGVFNRPTRSTGRKK